MPRLPESPLHLYVGGKSGREYLFQVYNIDDDIKATVGGVYIFSRHHQDDILRPDYHSHVFLSFASVNTVNSNEEALKQGVELGAEFVAYYASMAEHERQEIIKDIQAADYYQKHLIILNQPSDLRP